MEKIIEIPEGYEARIEGNKVILELKESENEKIRKVLINIVKGACDKYGIKYHGDEITEEKLLAWIEKQDKPKPTWSEEDERHKNTIIRAIHGAGNITPIERELAEEWLKSKIIK